MMTPSSHGLSPEEHRLRAMLALLRGEKASDVSASFGICRSDLYKFRTRALTAIREALTDHPRGPKRPCNRISYEREQKVMAMCQRHPTGSSFHVQQKLGSDIPSVRTIQRIRARHSIPHVPKRAPPSAPARRIPEQVMKRARYLLKLRPHLGPERVVGDLRNGEPLEISASTLKRLKRKTHEALHPAPPPPPPTVCKKLGIRLMYSAVRHPQSNGKLERACQHDMGGLPWAVRCVAAGSFAA
jgi:Helix-turn-helix domain